MLIDPLGYLDFLCLMKHATLAVTDCGGVQEETACLGIPCVTVKDNTERPVTVIEGTNIIAGTGKTRIRDAVRRQSTRKLVRHALPKMWDGQAATRIVATLVQLHMHPRESSIEKSPLPRRGSLPIPVFS